jgi:hypothetical protein
LEILGLGCGLKRRSDDMWIGLFAIAFAASFGLGMTALFVQRYAQPS